MKLKYLGTAAAEGWPGLFCQCPACKRALALGGRDIRGRAGSMINGKILIDMSPDLYAFKLRYHLDLGAVRHIVITHAHTDHFDAAALEFAAEGFAHIQNREVITVYGSAFTQAKFDRQFETAENVKKWVRFQCVAPFESFVAEGVRFTALPAEHSCAESYLYLLEEGNSRLLYMHDSGLLKPEVQAFLRGKRLDYVSLDCTNGPINSKYKGHMGFVQNRETQQMLIQLGAADANTRWTANHFSHNGNMTYDEMRAELAADRIEVAYDGMEIEC